LRAAMSTPPRYTFTLIVRNLPSNLSFFGTYDSMYYFRMS
jgi:hypothetical protein